MRNFGLYGIITQPLLPFTRVAEVMVECGVSYLQLREKGLSDRALLKMALTVASITKGSSTRFVVNDRADIALLSGADCLHLGQGDLPIAQARGIVGDMEIGLSTHSLEQAIEACALNPSYIGCGPVYPTPTKVTPDPVVGLGLLGQVVAASVVPVIAIGGIFPENMDVVMEAGARNVALVRYFMECDTVEQLRLRITEIQNVLQGR
ncbi:MAG: thiamine phosphate synthase [Mucinivorans sp.]